VGSEMCIRDSRWVDAGIVLVALVVVYGVYIVVPHGNLNEVIADHENGYNQAMGALDFRESLYHLAQLKLLKPGTGDVLGREKKVVLLQDVLTRPFVYHTQTGIRTLLTELNQASFLLPNDPDVKVVDAFVTWQLGPSRVDEYAAAAICAKTLIDNATEKPGQFFLRPLAVQYVRNYMLNPLPNQEIDIARAELTKTFPGLQVPEVSDKQFSEVMAQNKDTQADPLNPIFDIVNFDRITVALYNKTIPAYIGLVYVDSQITATQDASTKASLGSQRDTFAKAIGDAWQSYDDDISRLSPEAIIASQRVGTWPLQRAGLLRATTDQYTADKHNARMSAVLEGVLPTKLSDGSDNAARTLLNTEATQLNKTLGDSSTAFEQQLLAFVQKLSGGTSGEKLDAASKVELSAAQMGFFVCGEQFGCDGGTPRRDFSQVIQDKLKSVVGASNTFYQDMYAGYQVRNAALW